METKDDELDRSTGPPAEKRGWLEKKAEVVKDWRKRHFVLLGKFLFYTKKDTDDLQTPKGVIEVEGCEVSSVPGMSKHGHVFVLRHPRRIPVYLAAATAEEMLDWMTELSHAAVYTEQPTSFNYNGHKIDDPEDAHEIFKAHAEMRQYMYERYEEAWEQLHKAKLELDQMRTQLQVLKRQKKDFVVQVKQLIERLRVSKEECDRADKDMARLQQRTAAEHQAQNDMVDAVRIVMKKLETADASYLSVQSPNLSQKEVLDQSTRQLEGIKADIARLPSPTDTQLHALLCELLRHQQQTRERKQAFALLRYTMTEERMRRIDEKVEQQFLEQQQKPPAKKKGKK